MNPDEFTRRLPATATEERALIEAALSIPAAFKSKAAEIRSSAALSDVGKVEAVKAAARNGFADHLGQIRNRAAAMKADVSNLRTAMKLPPPDRSDLFAEMQKSELRTWLRTLSQPERIRAAIEDPNVGAAVLHAPPALSGLSDEMHQRIVDAAREKSFGPQLAGLEQRAEVLETVNAAIEIAESQFLREAGLTEKDLSNVES